MQQRPASRLNTIDQFFGTYSQSYRITKASRSVCVCVCPQSHRNRVVRAKTQVAISRSGGDAVSMSVKATGGRGGLMLPLSLEFLHSLISNWKMSICERFAVVKSW